MPDLDFTVVDAEVLPFAAVPTILFKLHLRNATAGEQIESILLRTQIRIEATRRHYSADAETRLLELFGVPQQWGDTLRSLLWTHVTAHVPRFTESIVAELPVVCTYDFEVAAAKYFHALEDGEVPLLFLFSGTAFYAAAEGGVQIGQIPWEKEATFRLPIAVWKQMMDRYFPNSAWLRVRKDVFDRLYSYKARQALPTWEDALDRLLREREAELER
ncbi:MAG TPA: DUF6084 family protein [Chloroflexota bacterium]|nr:DUF6084 family protein [Chloroflexota bacterium]